MTTKISIRFFNDHEVRAVWDEKNSKWWLARQARQPQHSATDNILAINDKVDWLTTLTLKKILLHSCKTPKTEYSNRTYHIKQ